MKNRISWLVMGAFILGWMGCGEEQAGNPVETAAANTNEDAQLFHLVTPAESGIDYVNIIREDGYTNNILHYDYMYNGAGVAVGDINNDGLADVYFAGNMSDNELYLNKGNLKFEKISEKAGVKVLQSWSTGVTMADVNNDGWLDIYVCRSYRKDVPALRENLLFINNGDLSFTESGKQYGVNDSSYSIQATFFDHDNDGDLDLFVANHPPDFYLDPRVRWEKWKKPEWRHSNKLFENDGQGHFTDITEKSGLLSFDWSLGLVASDMNHDGWTDLYVANDYGEPDRLYINNRNGTYTDSLQQKIRHMSQFAMGTDVADFNNDGLLDIAVVDMIAKDNYRQKTMMPSMNVQAFWTAVDWGFHWQYMHNSLQLNNGNGTFTEMGYAAGITNTDWSWTPLLADFDNDGWKDLYVTNGFRRDSRNVDFRKNYDKLYKEKHGQFEAQEIMDLLNSIPSSKLNNYLFMNNGDLAFEDKSNKYGIQTPSWSHGAVYNDLDNDGDLDLIVNNLLDVAFLYENKANETRGNHYLQVALQGKGDNGMALGAMVKIKANGQEQVQELTLTRGYQSSVDNRLHFGLGKATKVDEITVIWPDKTYSVINDMAADQLQKIAYQDANQQKPLAAKTKPSLFKEVTKDLALKHRHQENDYNDYAKEVLLPHKMSQFGPGLAKGDVNGDGLEDFYIGGAAKQTGTLYLQQADGHFKPSSSAPWKKQAGSEDLGALLFDADGDQDLDLYVVSGGNEFEPADPKYQDRLYVNDGQGNFKDATSQLPKITASGSCVKAGDYDGDGDLDLFVGGRVLPGKYPFPPRSYVLENDKGVFKDVTESIAPDLMHTGLVTDAVWSDFNQDGKLDLVLSGEWMPVSFFQNNGGQFANITASAGTDKDVGWWFSITQGDFDQDGDMDYVAGNLGLNYKYHASKENPFHVYCHDFDSSGTYDIVLSYYNMGNYFPVRGRQCSSEQVPSIKNKFKNYHEFGSATLEAVYGESLNDALHYAATNYANSYFENQGNGHFVVKPLPMHNQLSSVNALLVEDFNNDGNLDVLMAGNLFVSEIETGRADGCTGWLLAGDGKGNFKNLPLTEHGFFAWEDVKSLTLLQGANGKPKVLVGNNDDYLQIFELDHALKPKNSLSSL